MKDSQTLEAINAAKRVNGLYEQFQITQGEAVYKLLPLIEVSDTRTILSVLCDDLQQGVPEWLETAPKNERAWRKTRVFEHSENKGWLPELVAVDLSDAEIEARMKVTSKLKKYLSEESN